MTKAVIVHRLLAGLAVVVGTAASAEELCVTCEGPHATYRCQLDADAAVAASGLADPRARVLCITEIARQGRHETCAAERVTTATCDGPLRIVAVPAAPIEPAPGTAPAAGNATSPAAVAAVQPSVAGSVAPVPVTPGPITPGQAEARSPADAPPRTVQELMAKSGVEAPAGLQQAGKSFASTAGAAGTAVTGAAKVAGDAVAGSAKSAGGAVGDAAKKSWDCVASLFSKC